ncbi:MAG: acyl-CoA dehydratase activase-related protein [Bacillota bacterium]|nr:acyl-CoA dehydratase activase-related protein [Bacillota bacterium]MDW7684075.1 acyl-CoA dehydratase activase-related protein [Bacillota bacterium]
MSIKVGIPRALLYYHYYPGWEAFFRTLGTEIVLSDETTKKILDRGVRDAVDEACLPVKLYLGHLANLRDKHVDLIFAPRMVSVEHKKFLCPKFLGLPEMARFCVPDLPELLDVEINVHQKYRETRKNLNRLAARFNWRPWIIRRALREARAAQEQYEANLRRGNTPYDIFSGSPNVSGQGNVRVAVLGHAYNLNDPYISMNLIGRLREMGVDVVTSEMLRPQDICRGTHCLQKDIFWTFGKELMGAAFHLQEQQKIQGLILVASFGCGPDSLICEMVERVYKRNKTVPVLMLTLDEHTGEAGVVTRLEAFVDMLRWRKVI